MAFENKCMYCFEDLDGKNVCPHCGRDSRAAVPQIQLLPGTLLYHDRFLVGRAMGQDASGIVYMAYDTKRESTLRIREYLPRDSARRLNDGSVVPVAGAEDAFEKGMQRLKASIEAVEDPKKRHFYFEENGTAYIAQRKSAQGGSSARGGDGDGGRSTRQWALIIGGAAVAVLAVAFLLIRLLSNATDTSMQATPTPTLASDAPWTPAPTASPTPYVQTTFAPITDPDLSWMDYISGSNAEEDYQNQAGSVRTPTPQPNATPRPTSQIINGNSSQEEITDLQWQLIGLGWLDYTSPNGRYDSATRQAVRDFQTYMNNTYAINPKLTVDGIAGPNTLYWLDRYDIAAKPTQSPATLPPVVTEAPDGSVINENSSKSDIRRVQQLLIQLGHLPEGSDDGVYGAATRGAVWEFQDFVNRYYGREVLSVTGEVDTATRDYLIVFADWWEAVRPTATPTAAPTATPTAAPTPTATAETGVSPDSSSDRIRYMQSMLRELGFLNGVDGVYGSATTIAVRDFQVWVNEQQGYNALSVTGSCDEATLNYLQYYVDHPVTPTPTAAPTPTPTAAPTVDPGGDEDDNVLVDADSDPDSIYYMEDQLAYLGFLGQADGTYDSATTQAILDFQNRVNADMGYQVLEPNGVFNARTQNYLEEYVYRAQTQQTPAPTATAEPVGTVELSYEGSSGQSEGITLTTGDLTVRWHAQGDVSEYRVSLTDETGATIYQHTYPADDTDMVVPAANLTPNVVYELLVTAVPSGGGENATALGWIMLVGQEPTQPPLSTPAISADGATDNGGVYVFEGSEAYFSWSVEGDVSGYTATVYDEAGGVVRTGGVSGTGLSIGQDTVVPGQTYTFEITAHSASGGESVVSSVQFMLAAVASEPTPTAPAQMPTTIDRNSDAQYIEAIQEKLYALGMFTTENAPERGVFDQRTLEAVLRFQQLYNSENPGAPLIEVDPTNLDSVVDATTLALLMGA